MLHATTEQSEETQWASLQILDKLHENKNMKLLSDLARQNNYGKQARCRLNNVIFMPFQCYFHPNNENEKDITLTLKSVEQHEQ